MTPLEISELEATAKRARLDVVTMHHTAQTGHVGGALSCVDLLVAAYAQPDTRVILSKGHAASALYAVHWERVGRHTAPPLFSLHDFNAPNSGMPEQPSPHSIGTEWATGSLGHGLSVGLGMALADRMAGKPTRTVVILSDGECQEGSVWEAAMLAGALGVTNLVAVVDYNGWQAIGPSRPFGSSEAVFRRFEAFGWTPVRINGRRMADVAEALSPRENLTTPFAVIAHTLKGQGISFMEDDNNWHYRHPTADEVERARQELGL